jgi:hypothetical protein
MWQGKIKLGKKGRRKAQKKERKKEINDDQCGINSPKYENTL